MRSPGIFCDKGCLDTTSTTDDTTSTTNDTTNGNNIEPANAN